MTGFLEVKLRYMQTVAHFNKSLTCLIRTNSQYHVAHGDGECENYLRCKTQARNQDMEKEVHTVLTKSNPCYEARFSRRVQRV
jgi:hypothetical protein